MVAPDVTTVIASAPVVGCAGGPMESLHANVRIAARPRKPWATRICPLLVKANERNTSPASASAFEAHGWRSHVLVIPIARSVAGFLDTHDGKRDGRGRFVGNHVNPPRIVRRNRAIRR